MKKVFVLTWIIVLVICYTSCTVEKRVYNKGYHVRHTSGIAQKRNVQKEEMFTMHRTQKFENPKTEASSTTLNETVVVSKKNTDRISENSFLKPLPNRFDCDSLILKNGTTRVVSIITYNDSVIQYMACQNASEMKQISPGEVTYLVLKTGEKVSFIPYQYTDRSTVYYEAKAYFTPKEKLYKNFALASFGLSIGSIILAVFLFVLLSLWPALIVFAAVATLAIILGAIALCKIRKNPNLSKFSIYAILGIIFASLLLIASVVLLTGVALKWF